LSEYSEYGNMFGGDYGQAGGLGPFNPNNLWGPPAGDPFQISPRALMGLGQQYAPPTSYQAGTYGFPQMNVPFLGSGGNQLATALMGAVVTPMAAQRGFTPGNYFGREGNLGVALRNRAEAAQTTRIMNAVGGAPDSVGRGAVSDIFSAWQMKLGASEADAKTYGREQADLLHGMAMSPAGQAIIGTMGQALGGVDFLGLISPDVAMARGVNRSQRGMYRGGGVFGMEDAEQIKLTSDLTKHFYAGGNTSKAAYGFTAGKMGDIMVASQSLGILPGMRDASQMSPVEGAQIAADMARKGGPGLAEAVGTANTNAIKEKLSSAAKLFRLASEITGSEDVNELTKAIQVVTGGGAGRMSTDQIQGQLSKVQEVARAARMTMDQMLFIMAEGAKIGQATGAGAAAGSSAMLTAVQTATLASGMLQRELGGRPNPYGLTTGEMQSESIRAAASALGSVAYKNLSGAGGVLANARLTEGEAAFDARVAGLKLTDTEQADLAAFKRMQSGKATATDAALFANEAGFRRAADVVAKQTGLSAGEVRLAMQQTMFQQMGGQANPNLIRSIQNVSQLVDARDLATQQASGAILGKDTEGFDAARKAAMSADVADLFISETPGTPAFERRKEEVARQYGISNASLSTMLQKTAAGFNLVGQGSGWGDAASLTLIRAKAKGQKEFEAFDKALDGRSAVWDALRDEGTGGENFLGRLKDALRSDDAVDGALGFAGYVKNETLRAAVTKPLERVRAINARLKESGLSETERDNLAAERSGLRSGLMSVLGSPKQADEAVAGLTTEYDRVQQEAKDARTKSLPYEVNDTVRKWFGGDSSGKLAAPVITPEAAAHNKANAEAYASALRAKPLEVIIKDAPKDTKISGTLAIRFDGMSLTGILAAAENAPIGAGAQPGKA